MRFFTDRRQDSCAPPQRRTRRGNYSLLLALALPTLIGFAAVGVDLGYIQLVQLQAQYAADSASHAAFVAYRSTGETGAAVAAAEYILANNTIGGRPAALEDIDFGSWVDGTFSEDDEEVNAVRVDVGHSGDNALPLYFAPLFGHETLAVGAQATTAGRNRQIMIVQDITGSFRDDIDNAREADLAFLEFMLDNPYPGDMIGMSTFVGGVTDTVWSPLVATAGAGDAVAAQWASLDWCNCEEGALWDYYGNPNWYCAGSYCPLPDWETYCDEYVGGHDTRPAMMDCWTHGTNTAPGPGIEQAAQELLDWGDPSSFRAIVLVSDGLPCCDGQTEPRKAAGVAAADWAWENDIHVWSVAFNEGGGDFSYLEELTRGLGQAYETPDSAELEDILLEIAASIPVVTVQ